MSLLVLRPGCIPSSHILPLQKMIALGAARPPALALLLNPSLVPAFGAAELGVHPQAASATSGLLVLFSASSAMLSFAAAGRLDLQYAAVFGTGCMVAAFAGTFVIGRAVRRRCGRAGRWRHEIAAGRQLARAHRPLRPGFPSFPLFAADEPACWC